MLSATDRKIVIIVRKTRLDDIIERFNTVDQARFYVEHLGSDFSDYLEEDKNYKSAISTIELALKSVAKVQILDRQYLSNFLFGKNDLIVVVGQDGLVANTLKYLDGHPVIAINPDPKRWDGVLLPFKVNDAKKIVSDLITTGRGHKEITFAKVELSDGQKMYAVNDFFIGPKSHVSARYVIDVNGKQEQQSSSGIIVSTGLGSTGWFKSILTGAQAIVGKNPWSHENKSNVSFDWASDYIYYAVREPFPSKFTGAELVFGKIKSQNQMVLTSLMANNGVIFSDGIENDFIEFNSGMKASIGVADKKGILII